MFFGNFNFVKAKQYFEATVFVFTKLGPTETIALADERTVYAEWCPTV